MASQDEAACHEWVLAPAACPPLLECDQHTSCATCARSQACAWCGALERCHHRSETPFVACEGQVLLPEACPYPYTETTRVEGHLAVTGDRSRGGGTLAVTGPCDRGEGCRPGGRHALVLDGGAFDVASGGRISLAAADSNNSNAPGSEIVLQAGAGTNVVGGQGGDVFAFAGDAAGGASPLLSLLVVTVVSLLLFLWSVAMSRSSPLLQLSV